MMDYILDLKLSRCSVCFLLGNYPAADFICWVITQKKAYNMDSIVICFWIAGVNFGMKLDLVLMKVNK
jgi:hypothetical protein